MTRTDILQEIDRLTRFACDPCPERPEGIGVERGMSFRRCLDSCPIGKEFRELGRRLEDETKKRRMRHGSNHT